MAVYRHWIIGINGVGYDVPSQHVFTTTVQILLQT